LDPGARFVSRRAAPTLARLAAESVFNVVQLAPV
jgi:hypothetical protein